MAPKQEAPSARSRVFRAPQRADYDSEQIKTILRASYLCHVGFQVGDSPFVIPTCYALVDDDLVIHGALASRMLKSLKQGLEACITVTIVDGMVLARSAFHHSVNYRSVMIFGRMYEIEDLEQRARALSALVDHLIPGRSQECRPANTKELRATSVLRIPLDEASAKIRTGPPVDDDEDMQLPHWAGVLPMATRRDAAIPDPKLAKGIPMSPAVERWFDSTSASVD